MTALAAGAQLSGMRIILLVAIDTLGGCPGETLSGHVTLRALQIRVRT
ncbi:MAG TPA: hypothetical protein VFS47_09070 [Steroidobacteraceae bacterium]|nr:hypothetical protein [Steroidobacteraceae bacterium]